MAEGRPTLHRGLREVYIDRTTSSFIDGDVGKLLYRGYDIHDLAEKSTFEETAFLVMNGHLPTQAELDAFDAELKSARGLPGEVLDIIRLTRNSHPMDVLRTAVSALSAYDSETEDNSAEATLRKGIRLTAQAPTIVAAHAGSGTATRRWSRTPVLDTRPTSCTCCSERSRPTKTLR